MPDSLGERIALAKAILEAADLAPILAMIDDDPNNHLLEPVAIATAAIDSALRALDGLEPDLQDWHPIMQKLGKHDSELSEDDIRAEIETRRIIGTDEV